MRRETLVDRGRQPVVHVRRFTAGARRAGGFYSPAPAHFGKALRYCSG